jgi:hypothetical protein
MKTYLRLLLILSLSSFLAVFAAIGIIDRINSSSTTTTTDFVDTTEEDSYVIAAVGDISCSADQRKSANYPCVDDKVADLVTSVTPDYFVPLGDLQYNSATYSRLTGIYHKTWGHLYDITLPIPGNHEYSDGGRANGYFKYFPHIARPGYYEKSINDKWMLVALNTSDDCQYLSCAKGSDQYNWLLDVLARNYNKCVIVATHHPRYSSGVHGNGDFMQNIWSLLERYHVPLVLSGHDHNYERFNTSPVQFVVGTGGKDLRRVKEGNPKSAFLSNKHHGALFLNIVGSTVNANFMDIDGEVIDSSVVNCTL